MRITGGTARGIALKSVAGNILRPATDYLRQAIFSSLGDFVVGANFLDLFAGLGSYGLEALSRGAQPGIFVEKNLKITEILRKNCSAVCKSMAIVDENRIWHGDALKIKTEERFDLLFIDPPYDLARRRGGKILAYGKQFLKNSDRSRLIFEAPVDICLEPPAGLHEIRHIAKTGRNSPSAFVYCL